MLHSENPEEQMKDSKTQITIDNLKLIANVSKESAVLFGEVDRFEVKWYHGIFDRNLKKLEEQYTIKYKHFCAVMCSFQDLSVKDPRELKAADQIHYSMLSVAGHLYAEAGRILKIYRNRSHILLAIVLNVMAVFACLLCIY